MRISRQTLKIGEAELPYQIEYKGVKNVTLRFRDGMLTVSAPYGTSVSFIENLLLTHLQWIRKAGASAERKEDADSLTDHVVLWGQEYPLEIHEGSRRIVWQPDRCILYYPNENYEPWLKNELKKILMKKVEQLRGKYDAIMDDYHLLHPEIHYREMKSRWGSCMSTRAKITMNTRLVHYPEKCLDYVLLHEYMHFIEPNHSASFHSLLKYYMPDYREAERMLK